MSDPDNQDQVPPVEEEQDDDNLFEGNDDDSWLDVGLSDSEAAASSGVIVPKKSRGDVGSREYLRYMSEATMALESKMGAPSHMVSSRDGEAEDGDETRHRYIQETYVSNLQKVDLVSKRCIEFDFMDIILIPEKVDNFTSNPKLKYSPTNKKDLIVHFDTIPFELVKEWQKDINTYKKEADRISSKWLQSFLYKSCTAALRERIDGYYTALGKTEQGGVTYLYLVLKCLFFLSRDTVAALKKFLSLFRDKGLRRYKGENVVVAQREIDAVCSRLDEVGELPKETPLDIIEGFTLCSVPQFADIFRWMLQAARAEGMLEGDAFSDDPLKTKGTLARVTSITAKAVESYHALCTASEWHVSRGRANLAQQGSGTTPICWNCGIPNHTVKDCTKPKDKAKIEANKKKWQADRAAARNSNDSGGRVGERRKWGTDSSGSSNIAAQIQFVQGEPHAYCSKKLPDGSVCGWNSNHSTKYHGMAQRPGFDLAAVSPNHPLVQAKLAQGSSQKPPGTDRIVPPAAAANNVTIQRDKATTVLDSLERNASSEETIQVIAALRNLFSLK